MPSTIGGARNRNSKNYPTIVKLTYTKISITPTSDKQVAHLESQCTCNTTAGKVTWKKDGKFQTVDLIASDCHNNNCNYLKKTGPFYETTGKGSGGVIQKFAQVYKHAENFLYIGKLT